MKSNDVIYIGVKGSVAAFVKADGTKLWETHLKSRSFVSLLVDGPFVFAHTSGELFCLDAASGQRLWHDPLAGFGYGLASLAVEGMSAPSAAAAESRRRAQEASSSSAGTAAAAGG